MYKSNQTSCAKGKSEQPRRIFWRIFLCYSSCLQVWKDAQNTALNMHAPTCRIQIAPELERTFPNSKTYVRKQTSRYLEDWRVLACVKFWPYFFIIESLRIGRSLFELLVSEKSLTKIVTGCQRTRKLPYLHWVTKKLFLWTLEKDETLSIHVILL